MTFLELKDISERYLELLNPTTSEKILTCGRIAGMKEGARVIDFGCGYGEALVLWAKTFGVSGIGVDIRPAACARAMEKIRRANLGDRIQIVCGHAADYAFEHRAYDVASCIGATFIWKDGFRDAIRAMQHALKPGGRLIIGEPYWLHSQVSPDYVQRAPDIHTEYELLLEARGAGFEITYVLHSNRDDWDHYEAENWRGLSDWLDENPAHPEWQQVLQHLHESQEEYLRYGREYLGWTLYVLKPAVA